jgi:Transglycosylase SLT domain
VETSAYLAPDRKHNVSIPRTSRQSKSSRLALAATGAAAAVAVLVSGGAAAAAGAPAASYRLAAVQGAAAVSRIQPVGGQHLSPPRAQAAAGGQDALAGQATAAGRKAPAGRTPAGRTPAGHAPQASGPPAAVVRRPAGRPGPRHGTAHSRLSTNAAYIVVRHESGGNPHAYNGWDVNAAQGHPSEGIAQVIGPTFHSYKLHGYGDIWNPVDNMVAAFRYAISRYGSMNNIPGVVAVRQGGSYIGY